MWLLLAMLVSPAFAEEPPVRGSTPLSAPEAPADAIYDRVHAIVIGIDRYADLPPYGQLGYAVRDAKGVKAALQANYRVDDVVELYDEQATREGIYAALGQARDWGEDDAVFIFWAGHGVSEEIVKGRQVGYLVPHDGTLDAKHMRARNIPMRELQALVADEVPAKHVFLVVDACYGGILAKREVSATATPTLDYVRSVTRDRVFQVLTAGQHGETVLDGGRDGHSVFTGELIRALEAPEGVLTANVLAPKISERVHQLARERGHTQTPDYGRVFGTGDFVLLPKDGLGSLGGATDLGARLNRAAGSQVSTVMKRPDGRPFYCGGVVVAPDVVLTTQHCVADSEGAAVILDADTVVSATGVEGQAYSTPADGGWRDYALLKLEKALPMPPLEVRQTPVDTTEQVHVLGFAAGGRAMFTSRPVVRTTETILVLQGEVEAGNSGVPVVDDQGRLVGIVVAVLPGRGGFGGTTVVYRVTDIPELMP